MCESKSAAANIHESGGLLTYQDGEAERCLGYLMEFRGHGVFDPTLGKVPVTGKAARQHNKVLSQAELEGLDKNCRIGQGGVFYFVDGKVKTFTGELVSDRVRVRGRTVTFWRDGKKYRGRLQNNADCFRFRRVKLDRYDGAE